MMIIDRIRAARERRDISFIAGAAAYAVFSALDAHLANGGRRASSDPGFRANHAVQNELLTACAFYRDGEVPSIAETRADLPDSYRADFDRHVDQLLKLADGAASPLLDRAP